MSERFHYWIDQRNRAVMKAREALTAQAQELNMGYNPTRSGAPHPTGPLVDVSIPPVRPTKTLRDEFAMAALAAMVPIHFKAAQKGHTALQTALAAYEWADAMMEARQEPPR